MANKGIATCKATAALLAEIGPLASVELEVALQVVYSTELGGACLTDKLLFLRVDEEMGFEIVVSGEGLCAVRALKLFGKRSRRSTGAFGNFKCGRAGRRGRLVGALWICGRRHGGRGGAFGGGAV